MEQSFKELKDSLARRILIMDGAMGTRIQAFGLSAESFHRGRFASWPVSLVGNNDILSLTAPEVITDIHRLYIEAGADIIATNTFSSNRISQQEYGCSDIAAEMAREGARLARLAANEKTAQTPRPPLGGETVNGQWSMTEGFMWPARWDPRQSRLPCLPTWAMPRGEPFLSMKWPILIASRHWLSSKAVPISSSWRLATTPSTRRLLSLPSAT